jgi:hypothetical protein
MGNSLNEAVSINRIFKKIIGCKNYEVKVRRWIDLVAATTTNAKRGTDLRLI